MPESPRTPSYRLHKPSGRAVVTIGARDYYLGTHGSKASRTEYDRLISEWLANGRRLAGSDDLTLNELAKEYLQFCQRYYKPQPGKSSGELDNIRLAIRRLRLLYGEKLAREFGPLWLKSIRENMLKPFTEPDRRTGEIVTRPGWCRTNVNRQVGRVKQLFKWAVENERIPSNVYHGLQAVAGLRAGKTDARESKPVQAVPDYRIAAVRDFVSGQVWSMIQLQLTTGMRPGEVCAMRPIDIDTTGALWIYRPAHHKTEHHGHKREIFLGPKARRIIEPYFVGRATDAYLFSPAESEENRRQKLRINRKTPLTPSQAKRRGRHNHAFGPAFQVAAVAARFDRHAAAGLLGFI